MALVNVMVNGRAYTIACDDGEEERLRELAGHVDAKVREVLETVGQVGEPRLLLMAALLMADECTEAKQRLEAERKELDALRDSHGDIREKLAQVENAAADTLEQAAKRVEDIVAELGEA